MPVTKVKSSWSSGNLVFHESTSAAPSTTYDVLTVGTAAVKVGNTANDIDFQYYGTGSLSAIIDCGAASFTLTGISTVFTGVTAAVANGYAFAMSAGTIASETHTVDISSTGTLASGKSLVGLNVKATAAGTAGAWLAGLFVNTTQASKLVNGYLCAAEFELTSTAANASDNSIIVLNSVRNHTGSSPAADPYILLREYGTTYADTFVRVFGDTGQGDTTTFDVTKLVTEVQDTYEAGCRCAIRCMVGSTPMWLLGNTTAPTS